MVVPERAEPTTKKGAPAVGRASASSWTLILSGPLRNCRRRRALRLRYEPPMDDSTSSRRAPPARSPSFRRPPVPADLVSGDRGGARWAWRVARGHLHRLCPARRGRGLGFQPGLGRGCPGGADVLSRRRSPLCGSCGVAHRHAARRGAHRLGRGGGEMGRWGASGEEVAARRTLGPPPDSDRGWTSLGVLAVSSFDFKHFLLLFGLQVLASGMVLVVVDVLGALEDKVKVAVGLVGFVVLLSVGSSCSGPGLPSRNSRTPRPRTVSRPPTDSTRSLTRPG